MTDIERAKLISQLADLAAEIRAGRDDIALQWIEAAIKLLKREK